MIALLEALLEAVRSWWFLAEVWVGRIVLAGALLFLFWRLLFATFQIVGLSAFISMAYRYGTGASAKSVGYFFLVWVSVAWKGKVPKHNKLWAKRDDGKKVHFATWHGGFSWEIDPPNQCLTRVERMTRRRGVPSSID